METFLLNKSIVELRNELLRNLEDEIKKLTEPVYFSKPFYFCLATNSETIFSLYGIDGSTPLVDSFLIEFNEIKFNHLGIEALFHILQELEFYKTSKIISSI